MLNFPRTAGQSPGLVRRTRQSVRLHSLGSPRSSDHSVDPVDVRDDNHMVDCRIGCICGLGSIRLLGMATIRYLSLIIHVLPFGLFLSWTRCCWDE
jgi:hypothetical protein